MEDHLSESIASDATQSIIRSVYEEAAMMGAPQKEYIITEDQLRDLIYARYEKEGGTEAEDDQVHELVKGTLAEVRHSSTTSAEVLEGNVGIGDGSIRFNRLTIKDTKFIGYPVTSPKTKLEIKSHQQQAERERG